jgi:predicted glycosyltransferase involved in capsule biosynthesis
MSNKTKLSVIIPVRENGSVGVIERLSKRKIYDRNSVEIIVVDDGSNEFYSKEIESLVLDMGETYVKVKSEDSRFSAARARNFGLKEASSDFVYFEDLDLLGESNFYQKLINLIPYFEEIPFNFISIPILYLSEESTNKINLSNEKDKLINNFAAHSFFINPDKINSLIQSYAPAGSNILVKKVTCFHIGMFDEYFNSWGGEDRDFIFRLLNHNSRTIKPRFFEKTGLIGSDVIKIPVFTYSIVRNQIQSFFNFFCVFN